MAVAHKGSISMGLVLIPVGMYKATVDNDIHFNQLDKESKARIKYKKYCSHCGKEVTTKDIIKGYEYERDKYVVMTDEELERIKTRKDKTIHILQFARMAEVNMIYYDNDYYAVPDTGAEKAYELLRQALLSQKKVAIAKTVMGTNEKLLVLYPTKDGIIVKTLFYHDEIAAMPKPVPKMKLDDNELSMAKMLIENMSKPFNAEDFRDEYQARLRDAIMQKIQGQEIVAVDTSGPANVIDLMEALQKSLELSTKKDEGSQKKADRDCMMDMFEERSASPMLIAQQMEAFDDPDWIYELKMDGFRCLAYIDKDLVDFRNKRNMQVLSKFPELAGICKNVKGRCILDGEVVVLAGGVPDFYRLQKRTLLTDRFKIELEAGRFPASFVAFDCIYQDSQELIWEPLMRRKEALSKLVDENDRIAVSRFIEAQGRQLYQAADMRKLEGVVAKRKDSPYYMGKRTKDWIKFKRMADEDYVVAGYIQKGRHTYSLILGKYRSGALVYKGHVTSGVTKDAVDMLQFSGKNPFALLPMGNEGAVWVKPDHVCVVEYMPNLQNSLRQPVFKGFRDDVLPKEVRVE